MAELASWLTTRAWRERADADCSAVLDMPIRAYAQRELERRYERVRKRGRKLDELGTVELHELRIAVKKLRYALDFFTSLFEAEAVRALRSRLSHLQDVLGTMNDAATLPDLLGSVASETPDPAVAEARGILLGWSAGRANALRIARGNFARAWKAFRRVARLS